MLCSTAPRVCGRFFSAHTRRGPLLNRVFRFARQPNHILQGALTGDTHRFLWFDHALSGGVHGQQIGVGETKTIRSRMKGI